MLWVLWLSVQSIPVCLSLYIAHLASSILQCIYTSDYDLFRGWDTYKAVMYVTLCIIVWHALVVSMSSLSKYGTCTYMYVHMVYMWHTITIICIYYKCKNHVGMTPCQKLYGSSCPEKQRCREGVAEDCCMLSTLPCSAFLYLQFLARCHPYILFHF